MTSSGEVTENAFNAAFQTSLSSWDWYDLSEKKDGLACVMKGKEAGKRIAPSNAIQRGQVGEVA